MTVDERVGGLAVEEDEGALRSRQALGLAVADEALELETVALDRQHAIGERGGIDVVLEEGAFAVALAFDFDLRRAVPAGAGQATLEEHEAVFTLAEGDYVGAHLSIGEFTLEEGILAGFGGFLLRQVDRWFRRLRGGGGFGLRRVGGEKSGR